MEESDRSSPSFIKAFRGTRWFYCHEGILMSTWAVALPQIQDKIDLNDGELGLAALATYLFTVAGAPPSSFLIKWFGCRSVTIMGSLLSCLTLLASAFSDSLGTLLLTFSLFGSSYGILDTGMNSAAVIVEFIAKEPIFGQLCATYSVAAVLGSLGAAFLKSVLNWSLLKTFLVITSVTFCICIVSGYFMYSSREELQIIERKKLQDEREDEQTNLISPLITATSGKEKDLNQEQEDEKLATIGGSNSSMIFLCLIGFSSSFVEGIAVTWIVIYMDRYITSSSFLAALGYSIFYGCEAIGRFACDYLRVKLGRRLLLQLAGSMTAVGISTMLLAASIKPLTHNVGLALSVSYIGIALAGLGISVQIPTVLSSAGELPGLHPSTAIAIASVCTNSGSIVGPPIVGGLSLWFHSLRAALVTPVLASTLVAFFTLGVALEDTYGTGKRDYKAVVTDSETYGPLLEPSISAASTLYK